MRSRRLPLIALALAVVAGAAAAAPVTGAVRPRSAGGEIVFVSPRATEDPGEIYALASGRAERPVFHSPYAEVALATAPRGRALAFWSDRSGAWRLMISPDGVALRSVTVRGAGDLEEPPWPPVFSADGTRLLVPYLTRDAIAPVPALAVAAVASGPAVGLNRLCGLPPVWAPDGRAFACANPDQTRVQVADLAGHVRFTAGGKLALWSAGGRIAVSGGDRTTVLGESGRRIGATAGVARAWAPDGRLLAVSRADGLVLVQPGSRAAARVVAGGEAASSWVAFTPDGREIAFASGLGGARIAPVAGGAPRAFAAAPGGVWSRDGRYAAAVPASSTVHVELRDRLGHAGSVSGRLPYDGQSVSIVAWSGDGSRLLYDTSAAGTSELWAMATGGSGQTRLTAGSSSISQPAWSARGAKLAYRSGGVESGSIIVAGARGERLSRLPGATPGDPSRDDSPSWSPDGRRIAVADAEQGGVTAVDLASGKRTDVAVDGVAPAWSPGGATIAFVDLDDGSVWDSAPNGAGRHRLLPAAVHGVRWLAWSPDGKLLAFTTDNGIYVAKHDGVDPGRTVVAAAFPSRPSFSPDGSRLTYAATTGLLHPHRAVFVVGVDGKGRRQLTTGPSDSGDPAWRPAAAAR
jgi:Tol biopolymer transport system component